MSSQRHRVRISAPPGVSSLLKQHFPKASNAVLIDTANTAASMCAVAGMPLTREVLERLCLAATQPREVTEALELSLESVPASKCRSNLLLPSRKFTIYSMMEATTPDHFRKKAAEAVPKQKRVAVTVGAHILALVGGRGSMGGSKDPFALAVRNSAKFEFDLRQEAYCHRRFITDRALQRLARRNPGLAATHVYADSFGLSLSSRPRIDTAPYFFAAYYDFFQKHPEHFESLDVMTEVLAVTDTKEFRRLAASHHTNYIEQRDRWQTSRATHTLLARNQYVDPALYAKGPTTDLSKQATALVATSRSEMTRIVDVAVSQSSSAVLKQKCRANEKAWHDAIA